MNIEELETPNFAGLLREISEQQDKEFDRYLKLAQKAAQQGKSSVEIKVPQEFYLQILEATNIQNKYEAIIDGTKNNPFKEKEDVKNKIKEAAKTKNESIKNTLAPALYRLYDSKFSLRATTKETLFGTRYIMTIGW